jgi:hypothetical protein
MRLSSLLIMAVVTMTLCFSANAIAQPNCYFKPDANKILNNKNLDFYLAKMQSDKFKVGNNKNRLPHFVREQLTCLIGDSLLADPNEMWNPSDARNIGDVTRQLVFFAESNGIYILVYRHGGFIVSNKIILMRYKDKKLVDLWSGQSSGDLPDIKELSSYLQKNRNTKDVLNYNTLSY